jgi:D-tyrosyl-tRNA(Tyr) deacylase
VISVLQRVREARVEVEGQIVGAIGPGLLVLVCAERSDTEAEADKLLAKILKLRIFSDAAGKMNQSVQDIDGRGTCGGLLLVSQFTLAADTRSGMRPSFTTAAAPGDGRRWFDRLLALCRERHTRVETGRFGAHMIVSLANDGPVTFRLQS